MRSRRKKRSAAGIIVLAILLIAVAGVWVFFFKDRPWPIQNNKPTPTATPVEAAAPTPAPTAEVFEPNPVSVACQGLETAWGESVAAFDEFARGENKAALTEARLSLTTARADLLSPMRMLEALVQTGSGHWAGQSAQAASAPAFIDVTERAQFGVNVPDNATGTSLPVVEASETSVIPGLSLLGYCTADGLVYAEYWDGELVCRGEFAKTGEGTLAQVYRKDEGVTRLLLNGKNLAWAIFPGMGAADMGNLTETKPTWQSLSQGAEQTVTFDGTKARLTSGDQAIPVDQVISGSPATATDLN